MKFVATLPPRQHYVSVPSTSDRYLFEDHLSSALRINSPVPDPFGQEWVIISSLQKQKADRSEYPYRLVLKLFEEGTDIVPATLEREIYKGVFTWSYRAIAFYSFPLDNKIWLSYSFR
jgi:hypothetical protein